MLIQGLLLLVAGMGIVLVFLLLLIFVVTMSARVIPRFNHFLPDVVSKQPVSDPAPNVAIAVAIAAARQRADSMFCPVASVNR